jgi:hypothetical protein
MATSEPFLNPAEANYPSRPVLLTHARPRGSITEAALTSAMMMTTDVLGGGLYFFNWARRLNLLLARSVEAR